MCAADSTVDPAAALSQPGPVIVHLVFLYGGSIGIAPLPPSVLGGYDAIVCNTCCQVRHPEGALSYFLPSTEAQVDLYRKVVRLLRTTSRSYSLLHQTSGVAGAAARL